MTDDLIAFLRTRLNEDEQTAKALLNAARMIGAQPDFYGAGGPAAASYWQHHNEARTLADVDAKRRAINLYEHTLEYEDHGH